MLDLFADAEPWQEPLAAGAVILHRFAFNAAEQLIRDINAVSYTHLSARSRNASYRRAFG